MGMILLSAMGHRYIKTIIVPTVTNKTHKVLFFHQDIQSLIILESVSKMEISVPLPVPYLIQFMG
jgi:hypothetical protein